RRDGEVAVHVGGVRADADAAVVGQRDPALVELLVERLEHLALELELLRQLRERRQVDAALRLAELDEGRQLILAHKKSLPLRWGIQTGSRSRPVPRARLPRVVWELIF